MSNLKRLLVPIAVATALIVLTMSAHAQSTYTWAVTCKGTVVSSGFNWSWQLADGSTVGGGLAACFAPYNSGTGTIPTNTTGMTVIADITGSPSVCGDGETVTKSVNASQSLSVSIKLSIPSTVTFFGGKTNCLPGSAAFKLSSS